LCFWCDEKFILKHSCRNKRLYSLSVVEEEERITKDEVLEKKINIR
jgi:hypothetical protein